MSRRGDFDCVVWGEEAAVVALLEENGAMVRSVVSLNLTDATLALLSTRNDAARDISSAESADVDVLESHSAGAIR
jgi:hypothetical protein